ncbi:uracil phosphoribosyltransferase [Natronoflexus pectinivorans]|uniref:Uracil phosphoribosyltransferase n=1 Tax=Natronoflexus pectinivorans TaxID=682526 RepID=A0A4R2GJR1_9BACT|nr:uracil phosphoribosyltransferase [Natronoflexus pectinivorans]TCO08284.1 uracil phosphoribosyltransferase [Natronoflexus pectinivorans]
MEIKHINHPPTILNRYIAELRDIHIQKDPLRFRRNLERIGEIFAYEISKTFTFKEQEVKTPLGVATEYLHEEEIVLASILRAGIPMHNGLLNYFDRAENAFISAYRKYTEDGEFDIHIEYISAPDLNNKVLILTDPMLATGSSVELSYKALQKNGKPSHIHIVSIIASQAGVDYVRNMLAGEPVTLWLGVVDEELNAKSYIIPGLGDAGDLAYGSKL